MNIHFSIALLFLARNTWNPPASRRAVPLHSAPGESLMAHGRDEISVQGTPIDGTPPPAVYRDHSQPYGISRPEV